MALNPALSESLKHRGQQLTFDFAGDWPVLVLAELREWLAVQKASGVREMTIEQFRDVAVNQPNSSKCWGNLPKMALKAGLIRATDRFVKASSVKTHSHPVKVWEIV